MFQEGKLILQRLLAAVFLLGISLLATPAFALSRGGSHARCTVRPVAAVQDPYQEISGGYLWSPERNANGARKSF